MSQKYETLFEPLMLPNRVTLNNRLVMAPMTTQSSFVNGMVTTDEILYYKRRSKGLGAVITACAHVQENGRFAGSPSAATDAHIPGLAKMARAIQENGAKAILQVFHVGRMGDTRSLRGEHPVSASAVPALREEAEVPRALTTEEAYEMVEAFKEAVRRGIQAGFDGVEIHGANTYLIQQFFSPHSNRREDHWGGTLEKRMALPLAVVKAAKDAVETYADRPFILGYRFSPEELEEPGITMDDTLALVDELKRTGLDYLHISTGDVMQTSIRDKSQKKPVVQAIAEAVNGEIPLIGVGSIHTPEKAEEAR
uniref:NADH-dependent flavin oxidoreductase n=1 Tax=Atopococcus tabaci TaxID=269774 RepID=UPI002409B797